MAEVRGGRGHSRDDVARAALRILDEHGLPDLTMRRLAAVLEVQPSALYWHFPDKQGLLAEVADRIVAGSAEHRPRRPRGERPWDERVGDQATALRAALLAHRDGAEVVASTTVLGLGSSAARRALADALAASGIGQADTDRAAAAILHFVLGHVAHEQQRDQLARLGLVDPEPSARTRRESADGFRFGVDLLVRGLADLRTEGHGPVDRDRADGPGETVGPAGLEPTTSTV
ncbi:TetR family transcriptional regulator [Clavibacter michiganensis]|uniref:TetR family transcriptional regulator n=1 Tax=Clavibacter michiganensis TaxID=28447 RepID=UPI0009B80E23|nr:TetR/AcrR family transcriptional regulator C-terminal domain-containing protein [Clavibacter michiganensis]